MRIYWLNPPLSTKVIYPDLGWMNMNTACKEHEWIQPIINWSEYTSIDSVVQHIISNDPKVLCVSSYTWNHILISDICKEVKKLLPEIIIIRGGPQLEKYLTFDWYDYVCDATGHGEEFVVQAFKQISEFGHITNNSDVPWLIAKDFWHNTNKGKFVYPLESVFEHNMPYVLECISVAKLKKIKSGVQYETTRGCPYSCTYCEWGAGGTSAKLSEKPLDIILRDIEMLSMFGVRDFEFIDANFGILKRDVPIVNHIGEMKRKYGFPESVMMYGLVKGKVEKKEQLLEAMFDNNLMSYYFMSIQSISATALNNVKRTDISVAENIKLAENFRAKYNIPVKVELILGLPGSTIDDFYAEMDLIQITEGWDWPRAPLAILPQTEVADKLYQALHKIKSVRVGISENEEQDITYISNESVLAQYKSYQDIVISTYSYTSDEWKEMFFMNKAQKVIGPLIPKDKKASIVMREVFQQIKTKSWYNMFEEDLNRIVAGNKQHEDFMVVHGKTVEEWMKDYGEEIKFMVN